SLSFGDRCLARQHITESRFYRSIELNRVGFPCRGDLPLALLERHMRKVGMSFLRLRRARLRTGRLRISLSNQLGEPRPGAGFNTSGADAKLRLANRTHHLCCLWN